MEGPLSKWTNIIQGWQYRWFKIENDTLLYYTSNQKLLKRQHRGQIRLTGAVVGIDSENNSLFTITVEGKTFHMQGRDLKERNEWVEAINNASGGYVENGSVGTTPAQHFKQKTEEANEFLNTLVDKVKELEQLKNGEKAVDEKRTIDSLIAASNNLTNNVKHAIIYLQMAQARLDPNMKTEKLEGEEDSADEQNQLAKDFNQQMIASGLNQETFYVHGANGKKFKEMYNIMSEISIRAAKCDGFSEKSKIMMSSFRGQIESFHLLAPQLLESSRKMKFNDSGRSHEIDIVRTHVERVFKEIKYLTEVYAGKDSTTDALKSSIYTTTSYLGKICEELNNLQFEN